ncbi:MAG: IclR family transcriptional regulator, acetate operon repressor [Pseudonocardiales bacterium]|jgi:urocanate hydratase|nr:IclR family transcriptional regulator, acetate operon repressor [Pseudonocardiales bacterium]
MTTLGSSSASTRTVERALGLLAEVCSENSISLSECARRVDLPTSTALRLLRTLEGSGFVSRSADGNFHAGVKVIQLGAAALGRQSLVRLCEPGLQRIVTRTGESAYLAIPGPDDTAVFIAMVEGTHPVRHTSWVGRAVPLGELAVGLALRGEVAELGYSVYRDPDGPDVTGIAAPIQWTGGVAGALNLVGPTYRIDESVAQEYGEIVRSEADLVATQLGADGGAARRKATSA